MADSCEMLAKRQQSASMMAMADDIESAVDAPTLIGKERRSSPMVLACRHRPQTTHLPAVVAPGLTPTGEQRSPTGAKAKIA